jgi:serine/threonine-protein kinase
MGTVYLAHDPALDRRVAIKVLRTPAEPPADGRFAAALAKRFLREARSAARIAHPHVVTIHQVGEQAGRPYLVMEYVEGGSLADRVRRTGPLHWRDTLPIVRGALRGLAAAHAKGVIHRDVKPANLLCARGPGGEDVIKLVDFGLARVAAGPADGDLTFPGAFVGSPSYCAPEQAAGAAAIDGRADLYALAATWYALLTGQPPFVDDDPVVTLQRHVETPFPDVRRLAPTVPAAVWDLIVSASQKSPARRPAGALDLLALVEALTGPPAPAAAPPDDAGPPRRVPVASPAERTVLELETRLAAARATSDSTTQLATLRTLYGLYAQLNRREEAVRTYREALVLHIKLHAPPATSRN